MLDFYYYSKKIYICYNYINIFCKNGSNNECKVQNKAYFVIIKKSVYFENINDDRVS